MTDTPWTLAERYAKAHDMATRGYSVEAICRACRLTQETAECIYFKYRPDLISGRLKRNGTDEN